MFRLPSFLRLRVLFFAFAMASPITAQQTSSNTATTDLLCNCQFTSDDASNCRVYGQLGDDVLIPFYRANQTCLDDLTIKVASLDRDQLNRICPYGNSTDASVSALINQIRFSPDPATRAIQSSYPNFWTLRTSDSSGNYDLQPTITDTANGDAQVDCQASESACWNAIRDYFAATPSAVDVVCNDFHARLANELELEQSTVRIQLCQDDFASTSSSGGSSPPTSCTELYNQIVDLKASSPSRACSAYGLGIAGLESNLPAGCGSTKVTADSSLTFAPYPSISGSVPSPSSSSSSPTPSPLPRNNSEMPPVAAAGTSNSTTKSNSTTASSAGLPLITATQSLWYAALLLVCSWCLS
jgi:hypothetical protein